jgi:hypothetical protein
MIRDSDPAGAPESQYHHRQQEKETGRTHRKWKACGKRGAWL